MVDQTVGQHIDPLDDRPVGVVVTGITALGEDRNRLQQQWQVVFRGDDLAHQPLAFQRCGLQKSLREAVAQGRMQPLPLRSGQVIKFFGQRAERTDLEAGKPFSEIPFHQGGEVPRQKEGVAPVGAGILHRRAVAAGELAAAEKQDYAQRFAALAHLAEAGSKRTPAIGGAVCDGALFYGALIVKVEAGQAGRSQHFFNFHCSITSVSPPAFPCRWRRYRR